jgi:hypothetical protein
MELLMNLDQPLPVHMRINLRCADAGVSKQFLNNSKISSVFQKVGRETVPEHVRRNVPAESSLPRAPLDP